MNMMARISAEGPAASDTDGESAWNVAMRKLEECEAAYKAFEDNVWRPAHNIQEAFEQSHGLVAPGVGVTHPSPNYRTGFESLKAKFPMFFVPDEVDEELDRLLDEVCNARTKLMEMQAPNLAALRWKLDVALELDDPDDADGGSLQPWAGSYVRQTIADYRRLLTA